MLIKREKEREWFELKQRISVVGKRKWLFECRPRWEKKKLKEEEEEEVLECEQLIRKEFSGQKEKAREVSFSKKKYFQKKKKRKAKESDEWLKVINENPTRNHKNKKEKKKNF